MDKDVLEAVLPGFHPRLWSFSVLCLIFGLLVAGLAFQQKIFRFRLLREAAKKMRWLLRSCWILYHSWLRNRAPKSVAPSPV